jgi:rubrerythrin
MDLPANDAPEPPAQPEGEGAPQAPADEAVAGHEAEAVRPPPEAIVDAALAAAEAAAAAAAAEAARRAAADELAQQTAARAAEEVARQAAAREAEAAAAAVAAAVAREHVYRRQLDDGVRPELKCAACTEPLTHQGTALLRCGHHICRACLVEAPELNRSFYPVQPDAAPFACPVCQRRPRASPLFMTAQELAAHVPLQPFVEAQLVPHGACQDCAVDLAAEQAEDGREKAVAVAAVAPPATQQCTSCQPARLLCEDHV